jgi:hypothetical protein
MLAILLALASAAGYGGSDYAGGLAARRGSVIRITMLAQAVSAALMILMLPPGRSAGSLSWWPRLGPAGDDRNRTRAAGHHRRVDEPWKRAARAWRARPP